MLFTHQVQEVLDMRGCIEKNSSLISVKDKAKLEYISEEQSSHSRTSETIECAHCGSIYTQL